jgi:hypothetical protein
MPSTNKIQVYLPVEILEKLKGMAVKQNRSASNLAATYVIQSIEAEEGLGENTFTEAIALIKALAENTSPSDATVILAANELDIEPDLLFQLRDRLFKRGKQPNGK